MSKRNLVEKGIDRPWRSLQPAGFSDQFLRAHKAGMGPKQCGAQTVLVINPINTSVDRAVLTVKSRYSPAMAHGDVMLPVQVNEQAMGERFWRKLCESFPKDENCENRFIVIIGMHEECVFPEKLRKLNHPCFMNGHIISWVTQIVRTMKWPDDFGHYWSEKMIGECTCEGQIVIDWVYAHLEAMLEILRHNPSWESFRNELDKRSRQYEQTLD